MARNCDSWHHYRNGSFTPLSNGILLTFVIGLGSLAMAGLIVWLGGLL